MKKKRIPPLRRLLDKVFQDIWDAAREAGKTEAERTAARMGSKGCCGFGSVVIMPARGPFVSWCRRNGIGHHRSGGLWRGWEIMVDCNDQREGVQYAYAEGMARVFKENDLNVAPVSRPD